MLSDHAIISGIKIGETRESEAIQAIYEKFSFTLQKFISLTHNDFNAAIILETVECFVNGVKNGIINPLLEEEKGVGFYLNQIALKIKYPEKTVDAEIEKLFDDKIVWDYYLNILSETEDSENRLLTQTFGRGTPVEELTEKLVAKGKYSLIEEVKAEKYNLISDILPKL